MTQKQQGVYLHICFGIGYIIWINVLSQLRYANESEDVKEPQQIFLECWSDDFDSIEENEAAANAVISVVKGKISQLFV